MSTTNAQPEYMNVANEILRQLGSGRFLAMTGAKHIGGSDKERGALSFRLPGNITKGGINHVEIVLTWADTYRITYGRIHGLKYSIKATAEDVYADVLRENFERHTGLATRF